LQAKLVRQVLSGSRTWPVAGRQPQSELRCRRLWDIRTTGRNRIGPLAPRGGQFVAVVCACRDQFLASDGPGVIPLLCWGGCCASKEPFGVSARLLVRILRSDFARFCGLRGCWSRRLSRPELRAPCFAGSDC
jgi:hypothetical protein